MNGLLRTTDYRRVQRSCTVDGLQYTVNNGLSDVVAGLRWSDPYAQDVGYSGQCHVLSVEEDELPPLKVSSKVSSHVNLRADVRPLLIEPFL